MRFILTGAIALLSATAVSAQDLASVGPWDIGPVIRGKNYSFGMPPVPTPEHRGWSFNFPYPSVEAGHVHYVTLQSSDLRGKSKLVMRYRVDAARGVRFVPREHPELPGTVSLFLQRRGDNWSGKRGYEFYRWYSPPHSVREIAPGEQEVIVSLYDGDWISVQGRRAAESGNALADAVANVNQVGLVFGSTAARGHGVFSTGPARFTLLSFRLI